MKLCDVMSSIFPHQLCPLSGLTTLCRKMTIFKLLCTGLPWPVLANAYDNLWHHLGVLELYQLSDIRIPKIMNARSGQASSYVSEQNVLLHGDIDLVDDIDKKEAECFR